MRLTVVAIQIAVGRFDLTIREPGIIRYVAFEQKKTLVMRQGDPGFEEVPVLFVESSHDMPTRKRTFVAIQHGEILEPSDDEVAAWRGTGLSGRGLIVHIFEMRPAAS